MSSAQPIAIVTGASSGFGLLTSIALARSGYRVMATMRDTGRKSKLIQQAEAAGVAGAISVMQMNVHDHAGVEQVVGEVFQTYRRIDVLVNNAGFAAGGFVEDVPMEMWREQMETNVFGLIAVTRSVLPYMREQKSGTIINVGSVSGRIAYPGYAPYSASKFAVEGFSEALRLEMKPFGVLVALVEPGPYQTDIWEKGFTSVSTSETSAYRGMLEKVMSFSRKIAEASSDPAEVANTIVRIAGSKRPALRYPLGKGIRLNLLGKTLLPWQWYEAIVSYLMKR